MINITHAQAQRLIRAELDRVIPEAQWNALQAHLEGCADCRTYQNQRKQLEKHLRRAMRAYWTQQESVLVDRAPVSRRMSGAADKISTGDFNVPEFPSTGNDEVSGLGKSFNRMRRSLQKALKIIER